jgi:cell filamentation protein, protein adenylyltransferase
VTTSWGAVSPRGRPSRAEVYARFESAANDLKRLGGLPSPSEAAGIWDDIWHLEAHNSTALEGNTLILREVQVLLDTGRAVGAKELKDYLEVTGYADAAKWVYTQAHTAHDWDSSGLITVTEIRHIHTVAMSAVWDVAPHPEADPQEGPGSFRRHDLNLFGGGMTPPPWTQIRSQLHGWIHTAVELGQHTAAGAMPAHELPLRLARLHCSFETIHPFLDGNGRAGRLLLNLLLVRLGWPPAIIFKRSRDRYLDALDRADHGDDGPLAELIARSVLDNLQRLVVPHIAGPARLIPLQSMAGPTISYPALRQAATRGRLEAEIGSDGLWRSNQHAVDTYLANRHQRRPHSAPTA